jgi:predicted nucleic acid-binding Zn ribbon protein
VSDDAREARQRDRRRDPYARERWRQEQRRADIERDTDVRPPTDDDYTVEDRTGLRIVPAPETVGGLLGGYVDQRGWGERLRGARLTDRWEDVVGPELARRCEPVRVAGGVLVVRAESQTWATQLSYMTRQLVSQVNDHLGSGRVREVRVVVGPLGRGEDPRR